MIPIEIDFYISNFFNVQQLQLLRFVCKDWNLVYHGHCGPLILKLKKIDRHIFSIFERLKAVDKISEENLQRIQFSCKQIIYLKLFSIPFFHLSRSKIKEVKNRVLQKIFMQRIYYRPKQIELYFGNELAKLANDEAFLNKIKNKFVNPSLTSSKDYAAVFVFMATLLSKMKGGKASFNFILETEKMLQVLKPQPELLMSLNYFLRAAKTMLALLKNNSNYSSQN